MSNHVEKYLSPYMDGELSGKIFLQVKAHLAVCEDCATTLRELKSTSISLHEIEAPIFPSKDLFASKVLSNLPEKQSSISSSQLFNFALWAFPILLMLVWVFINTTSKINNIVAITNEFNLLNDTSSILIVPPVSTAEPATLLSRLGIIESGELSVASIIESLVATNLSSIYINSSISILYMVWIFVWWMQSNEKTKKLNFSKTNLQNK